jgi:hypothetical protein
VRRGRRAQLALLLILVSAPVRARAQAVPEPEAAAPAWGGAIGAGVLTGSLAIGGALYARDSDPAAQRRGLYLIGAGLALAPWVSHGVDRRWRRAVAFGLVSLATTGATLAESERAHIFDPTVGSRNLTPFIALLTAAVFGSAIGVADSFVESGR